METKVKCDSCGYETDESQLSTVDGAQWCHACVTAHTFVCEKCNNITKNESKKTVEGSSWCNDCADTHAITCDKCGDLVTETREVDGTYWCDDCVDNHATRCAHCRSWTNEVDTHQVDGDSWCPSCYDDHTATCNACGDIRSYDNLIYDEESGNYYCRGCEPARCEDNDYLYHYHDFDKRLRYYGTERYAGFELEVGGASSFKACNALTALQKLDPSCSHSHCEKDSSIPDHGFELVSMPHDMKEHVKYNWDNALSILRSNGLKANSIDGCGLHVHVSNEGLKPCDYAKIDIFVAHNVDFFTTLARRTSNRYAKPKDKGSGEWGKGDERYAAVNFTPDNTIEFRLWKATMNYEMLLGYIELSIAIVEWTKAQRVMSLLRSNSVDDFKSYLATNCPYARALVTKLLATKEGGV